MTQRKQKKSRKQVRSSREDTRNSLERLASASSPADGHKPVARELSDWISLEAYRWGWSADTWPDGELPWNEQLGRKKFTPDMPAWPDVAAVYRQPNDCQSIELLACVLTLARFVEQLDVDELATWLDGIDQALESADPSLLETDAASYQLLYGEIPWTLGMLLSGSRQAANWQQAGRTASQQVVESILDGNGIPGARYLPKAGLLLGSWTRCLLLGHLREQACFDPDAQTQFEYFARQMIAMLRKDGSLAFSDDQVDLRNALTSALSVSDDEEDRNIARAAFPKRFQESEKKSSGRRKRRPPSLNALPESSACSEWGEVAILQSEWLPKSPKLIVDFHHRRIRAELIAGHVLLGGEIRHDIFCNDQAVHPASDWEVVCWHSDQDGDFLELECELDNGTTWQKQFLLARNELFLLISDVLLDSDTSQWRLESGWDLGRDIGFGTSREHREVFLTRKAKTVAAALPIAQPEWRQERSDSTFEVDGSSLVFRQSGAGGRIYAPLFVDLDPQRCRKPLTWRQLTVAENLEIVPPSQAAAFRIQVGGQQWLVYRSLTDAANRTFIGQNLSVEFFVGTLESDGTCSEIISVD